MSEKRVLKIVVKGERMKKQLKHGTLLNGDIDKWSEKHVGSLALTRTIVGFLNVALTTIVVFKLFGVI